MSNEASTAQRASQALDRLKMAATTFWLARDRRERTLLSLLALAVALGLAYALLVGPALTGRAQLEKNLPQLRQQSAELNALSKEMAGLSGKTTVPVAVLSKGSLEEGLLRSGLTAQNVLVSGDLVKVQFAAVPFAGLLDWLSAVRAGARLSVQEASVTALAQAGSVSATLTLRQQKAE